MVSGYGAKVVVWWFKGDSDSVGWMVRLHGGLFEQ